MAIYRIEAYRPGKARSRKEGFVPVEPERVIAVTPDEVEAFLNLQPGETKLSVLRTLATIGVLIRGRGHHLTRSVRAEDWWGRPITETCYVFRPEVMKVRARSGRRQPAASPARSDRSPRDRPVRGRLIRPAP